MALRGFMWVKKTGRACGEPALRASRSEVEPRRKPGMIARCDPPDLSGVSPIRIGSLASTPADGGRRLRRSRSAYCQARPAVKKTACGVCGRVHRGVYDRTVRRVRDLPCGGMRILVELELRRLACRRCGAVKRERLDFLADNPRYTKRFAFYVGRLLRRAALPRREHPGHRRGAAS
jgi:hypothetical protein